MGTIVSEIGTKLLITQLDEIYPHLLNDKAKGLANNLIKSTIYDKVDGQDHELFPCVYAAAIINLDHENDTNLIQIQRWARFLNDLADKGIWQHGSLAPFSNINLYSYADQVEQGAIFSYIFTKYSYNDMKDNKWSFTDLVNELNKTLGVEVFVQEGSVGSVDSWNKFPY